MDGCMGGQMGVKADLRFAYSIQKFDFFDIYKKTFTLSEKYIKIDSAYDVFFSIWKKIILSGFFLLWRSKRFFNQDVLKDIICFIDF